MAPDFKIAATDNGLEISGEFYPQLQNGKLQITVEGGSLKIINCCAFSLDPFEKRLELPEGYDLKRATAAFVQGVLRIKVPKKLG